MFKRVRESADLARGSVLTHVQNITGQGAISTTYQLGHCLNSYASIHDVSGKERRSDGRWPPTELSRDRLETFGSLRLSGPQNGGTNWTITSGGKIIMDVPHIASLIPSVAPSLLSDLAVNARNNFYTQIPTEVSLPNFGWEAREIKDLIPRITRGKSRLDTARKSAAGGFLNYSFGWSPLLDDIQKLHGIWETVGARLDFLRSTRGRRTRLHSYHPNVVSIPAIRFKDYGGQLGALLPVWLRYHRSDIRFNGFLYQDLEGLDEAGAEYRAIAGALGIMNPYKVLWEALPFSFMVDWFTRIGSFIDSLAVNPFRGVWEVSDLTYTVHSVTEFVVYQTGIIGGFPDLDLGPIGTCRYSRFDRRLGFPEQWVGINLTSLTPQQLLLTMALLGS